MKALKIHSGCTWVILSLPHPPVKGLVSAAPEAWRVEDFLKGNWDIDIKKGGHGCWAGKHNNCLYILFLWVKILIPITSLSPVCLELHSSTYHCHILSLPQEICLLPTNDVHLTTLYFSTYTTWTSLRSSFWLDYLSLCDWMSLGDFLSPTLASFCLLSLHKNFVTKLLQSSSNCGKKDDVYTCGNQEESLLGNM